MTFTPSHGAAAARPSIPALTGLRWFAALAVYLSHLGAPANSPRAVRIFFGSGYVGVSLFFVLSGFVLAINYFDELSTPRLGTLWRFAMARLGRVYPLYALILGYVALRTRNGGGSLSGIGVHFAGVQAWEPDVNDAFGFNGPAWSVSIELFLYLCFPVIVVALARVRRIRAILAAMALLVVGLALLTWWFHATGRGDLPATDPASAHRWLYRSPITRLADFTLGILAARLYVNVRDRSDADRVGRWAAAAGALAMVVLMSRPALYYTAWSWDVAYVVPALALIGGLACARGGGLTWVLTRRPILLLGEASFAFYLVHMQVLGTLPPTSWRERFTTTGLLTEMSVLGATICLAVGLHIVIERPARDAVRAMVRWLSRPRRVVAAPTGFEPVPPP